MFWAGFSGNTTELVIPAKMYNDILDQYNETFVYVIYPDNGKVGIVLKDFSGIIFLFVEKEDLEEIRLIIKKYFEWNTKAIKKQVMIEKDIAGVITRIGWEIGDTTHFSDTDPLKFTFYSRSKNDHELKIVIEKATSVKNQYITRTSDCIYLTFEQVKELQEALSEEVIAKQVQKAKDETSIEDEFN